MRTLFLTLTAFGLAASAFAAEPDGCDKFKWPIEADRAALTAPDRATVESGISRTITGKAIVLSLKPINATVLPMPPEKTRGDGNFAGYVKVAAPEKAGSVTISMSSRVWIDVIQDGRFLKPVAVSGARGCEGIRKAAQFDLAAQPFVVQLSGIVEPSVGLVIRASD